MEKTGEYEGRQGDGIDSVLFTSAVKVGEMGC